MGVATAIEERFGDMDELFSFQTGKVVVLKDRFLGILALLLKAAIIVYLIITVVLEKGYLVIETPKGTTRMTIRIDQSSTLDPAADYAYCTESPNGKTRPLVGGETMPCAFMDTDTLRVPSLGSQFFIPTRVNLSSVQYSCSLDDPVCMRGPNASSEKLEFSGFVAGVEEATLYIGHTVEGHGVVQIERTLTQMTGVVKNCAGDVVKRMPKRDPRNKNDLVEHRIFKVKDLLKWAQPGLDAECEDGVVLDSRVEGASDTLRYDGIVMRVLIEYDNTVGSTDDVEYEMRFMALKRVDSKYVTTSEVSLQPSLQKVNRHGIHVIVTQTGKLGRFSFAALVISATAGLGLLAIATTITDLLAKYVMPLRDEYRKLIFEYSQDFSDFRDREKERELVSQLNTGSV